jgi:hypothetical protein
VYLLACDSANHPMPGTHVVHAQVQDLSPAVCIRCMRGRLRHAELISNGIVQRSDGVPRQLYEGRKQPAMTLALSEALHAILLLPDVQSRAASREYRVGE